MVIQRSFTFVTRLAAAGVAPRTIMELAGHTSINTTMIYMHVIAGSTAAAMATLEPFDRVGHLETKTTS